MNDESRLPHSIVGTIVTWMLTFVAWFGTHIAEVAGMAAILASAVTIWAGIETALWRRKQRKDGRG